LINLDNIAETQTQTTSLGSDKKKNTTSSQYLPDISSYGMNRPDLTSFSSLNMNSMNINPMIMNQMGSNSMMPPINMPHPMSNAYQQMGPNTNIFGMSGQQQFGNFR